MAGTITPLFTPAHWKTEKLLIGTSATSLQKPSTLPNLATVVIQAGLDNTGRLYFSAESTVSGPNYDDAGGELGAGQSAVLPLNFGTLGSCYLIATAPNQEVFISYYSIGSTGC